MKVLCSNYLFCVSFFLVFISFINTTCADEDDSISSKTKNGRFLSMFEIVNFPNDACDGDSKNGTCYTSAECEDKGGTKDGSCASSYGVCCTFDVSCGSQVTENNTYFTTSTSVSSGTCALSVCPGDNICQLRLDFNTFVINGPYTSTITTDSSPAAGATTLKTLYGIPNAGGIETNMQNSQCITDSFSVTSPGGSSPPVICGVNTGEHMYVDASSSFCNNLGLALGSSSTVTRSWEIRVSQFKCDYNNLAPSGCTQYYFGNSNGQFRSFNYNSGSGYNLANQKQTICFRRETGKSQICYSYIKAYTDFDVSLTQGAVLVAPLIKVQVGLTSDKAGCCGYGNDGKKGGYDCLFIPSAMSVNGRGINTKEYTANAKTGVEGAFCGQGGLGGSRSVLTTSTILKGTVCSKRAPFQTQFSTDSFEYSIEAEKMAGVRGFQLAYILN